MRHKLLGRSGLRVSELCLGAMTFGGGTAMMTTASSDAESREIFDLFAQAGGTFIDTAVSYSHGRSEELLGDFLAADRDHFVVATKYGNAWTGGLTQSGNSRRNMMLSVERSLRQLKTDRIDLLWLHVWDYTTGIDEIMRGFDDLVSSGKVLYVGFSDTPAWEVSRANMMADLLGMNPVVAIQVERSLLQRTTDHDLLPMARALELGVAAWSPLAAGLLARPSDQWNATTRVGIGKDLPEHQRRIIDKVNELARHHGVPPSAIALAALSHHPADHGVFPIVGARTTRHLQDALRASEVTLSDAEWSELEALSRPPQIFPYTLIDSAAGPRVTSGGEPDKLAWRNRTGRYR